MENLSDLLKKKKNEDIKIKKEQFDNEVISQGENKEDDGMFQ